MTYFNDFSPMLTECTIVGLTQQCHRFKVHRQYSYKKLNLKVEDGT